MRRRSRRILSFLCLAALLIAASWLTLTFVVVPLVVRWRLNGVLGRAGFENPSFQILHSSFRRTDIASLSAGRAQELRIGSLSITYSPLDAIAGHVESVHLRDAVLVIPLSSPSVLFGGQDGRSASAAGRFALPVGVIGIDSSTLLLQGGSGSVEIPLRGILSASNDPNHATFSASAAVAGGSLNISGDLNISAGSASLAAVAGNVELSQLLHLLPPDARNSVGDLRGPAGFDLSYQRTAGAEQIEIRARSAGVTVGGQDVSDIIFDARMNDRKHIAVRDAQLTYAGGRIMARPLEFDLGKPSTLPEMTILVEHVDLAAVLALVGKGRLSGTGKLSGQVPLAINWPHIALGEGLIQADVSGGTLRVDQPPPYLDEALTQAIPKSGSDGQVQQVKQQILSALLDFQYDKLTAKVTRDAGEGSMLLSVYIEGRGRTGMQQPLDLTLNFRGLEHGINSYLAARSRVLNIGSR